jgi:hypothetical protein
MIGNRNIVIKREGNRILLPTIERKEVNVPNNTPSKVFLMCRIVSYDPLSGTICLKLLPDVVNDHHYQIAIEVNSELLSSLYINRAVFVDFPSSSTFLTIPLKTKVYDEKDSLYQETIPKKDLTEAKISQEEQRLILKEKQTVNITIELPAKELKFLDGKVSFEHYITHISRKVLFDIAHPFLKKEYDSIKNYFPKVLNINKFTITIHLEYREGKILNYTCQSTHISMIDDSLFELVEDLYITDYIVNSTQDEIFSLNEIAFESSKKIGSDNMQDAEWLLNKLIAPGRTKHYYHLRYLSDKHLSKTFNLRLTGKPLSFIFLLPVPTGFCMIWETYSTQEATYVWKFNNINALQLISPVQELVERIKWLRGNNKMVYLKTKPDNFIRIEHDYSGEDLGFKKWRTQLEEFVLNNKGKA